MPGFIAKKLCPDLVIVKLNFSKYRQVSEEVRQILAEYDPHFSPMGLDESYLNLTEYVTSKLSAEKEGEEGSSTVASKLSAEREREEGSFTVASKLSAEREREEGSAIVASKLSAEREREEASPTSEDQNVKLVESTDLLCADELEMTELPSSFWDRAQAVVEEMRARIFQRTGLTASAGIAPNKMLAKIASDMNKPNGQFLVTPTREGVLEFVHKLPIRKVSDRPESTLQP